MKKTKSVFWPFLIFVSFLVFAIASATQQHTYKPKPQPCITHKALGYSPILVKINLSGTYTMKDLQGAQINGTKYLIDLMNTQTPHKSSWPLTSYAIADGVTPNLDLYVTVNMDSYQHYGASITGNVFDGSFNITLNTDYYTSEKLFDDIADHVNWFVTKGWCKNCPQPCNP